MAKFEGEKEMVEIRYWQNNNENTLKSGDKTSSSSKYDSFRAFEATMLDTLMDSTSFGSDSSNIAGMFSSNSTADSLFGNLGGKSGDLEDRLKNIQDQGMSKVLAAQFSNPLPKFGSNQSKNSSDNDMGGLNDMIALTLQSQMIKARSALESQFGHLSVNSEDQESVKPKSIRYY